jgi:hypothetical protein
VRTRARVERGFLLFSCDSTAELNGNLRIVLIRENSSGLKFQSDIEPLV